MTDTAKALDRIVGIALVGTLKAQGFRKAGRTWRRATNDGVIQVVNVQGSVSNTDSSGRCALNAGLYFPELADVLGIGRVTEAPSDADCHLRVRPAMLRPDRLDTWFDYRAGDAASEKAAGIALADLYVEFGSPWLAKHGTLRAARDELTRTGPLWWASAASLCLGETADAQRLLALAVARATPPHAPFIIRWGKQHALSADIEPAV